MEFYKEGHSHPMILLKYLDMVIHIPSTRIPDMLSNFSISEIFNYHINYPQNKNNKPTVLDVCFLLNGRIISGDIILSELISRVNIIDRIHIEAIPRLRGGMELEDIPVIGLVFQIFGPLINPIIGIGNVFVFLLQFLIWLGKFIYWFIFFMIWAFTDLLNPVRLIADFWNSILLILITLINTFFGVCMGLAGAVVNQIGQWFQGFWGWDMSSLTKRDKQSRYFKGIDTKKGKKCYLTNNGRVPFSILLGTILCPPIGVFMDLGMTGWMNIFICALLTVLFYLPGLFYALLVIYA